MNEVKHTPGDRVRRYLAMRAAKPMKQLGDIIHTVNASSEWEGELKLSDLKIFAEQHAEMLEALEDVISRFIAAFPASKDYPPIAKASAIISKAKGKTP